MRVRHEWRGWREACLTVPAGGTRSGTRSGTTKGMGDVERTEADKWKKRTTRRLAVLSTSLPSSPHFSSVSRLSLMLHSIRSTSRSETTKEVNEWRERERWSGMEGRVTGCGWNGFFGRLSSCPYILSSSLLSLRSSLLTLLTPSVVLPPLVHLRPPDRRSRVDEVSERREWRTNRGTNVTRNRSHLLHSSCRPVSLRSLFVLSSGHVTRATCEGDAAVGLVSKPEGNSRH